VRQVFLLLIRCIRSLQQPLVLESLALVKLRAVLDQMFESCFEWAGDKTRLALRAGFGGLLAAG